MKNSQTNPGIQIYPLPFLCTRWARRAAGLFLVTAVINAGTSAQAANATWSGAASAVWNNNSNWSAAYPGTSGTTDIATFNSAGNGNTTITAGTLSLGGITFDTANAAAYTIGSGTLSFTNPVLPGTSGLVNVTSTVLNNQTISANIVAGNSGVTLTVYPTGLTLSNTSQVAALNVSGAITGPASTGNALLNLRGTGAVNISGAITDGTTKLAINSNRVGTTTLSGANTFSGISNSGNGATFENNLSVGMGGRLVLDYSGGNVVVPASTIIALGSSGNSGGTSISGTNSGGTLVFKTGTTGITVGNLIISNTYNNIVVDANGGSGAVVTLGNNWSNWGGSSRATVNVDLSAAGINGGAKLSAAPAGALSTANGVLRSHTRAVTMQDSTGSTYFANLDVSNNIVAQTTYTTLPTNTGSSTTNYKLETTTTATGNTNANVVRIAGTSANQTYDLGGFTLTLNSAAMILDGANNFTVTNGNITTSGTPNGVSIGAFGAGKLTVGAAITGNKDINRSGNGLVEFTGNNSANTGATRAESGVTRFSAATAITGGSLIITNGGIVEVGYDFTRALGTGAGQVQFISGAPGGFSAYGADHFVNIGGSGATLTYATPTVAVNSFVASRDSQLVLSSATSDSTIDFQNGLNFASDTQTIKVNNGTAAVDAKLSGQLTAGGLVKSGTGTLSITGNTNNYADGTVVSAGTLLVNNTSGSGTGTGAVTVANGATLGGSGTISGAVTVQSGGMLAPGNSPGNQTFGGGLTLAGSYNWELAALSTSSPGTNFDTITVTAGDVDITGGSISLTLGAFAPTNVAFWNANQTWSGIINNTGLGSLTGSFAAINNSSWSSIGAFTTVNVGNDVNLVWTAAAIPEPSTWVLLAFSLTAGMVMRRRRQA